MVSAAHNLSIKASQVVRRQSVLVASAYAALALVFTWPLATHLSTHVIGPWHGDNFEYVWKIWWVAEALFTRHISPFFHPDIYYPFGYNLAYGEITPVHTFLLAPLTLWWGEVITYNFACLLSIWFSGISAYWLARRWLSSLVDEPNRALATAAFFAGAIFALCSYRMVRIAGHLPLIDTHWLVLALLGLDRWLEKQRVRDAVLVGISTALAALSSWYYALMLVLLLPVYVIAQGCSRPKFLTNQRTWRQIALIGGLIVGICLPFALPYVELAQAGETAVSVNDVTFWSASPVDYLMPNPRHPLWGDFIQGIMWPLPGQEMPAEFVVSIGWITLILGLWSWRQVHGPQWRGLKWIIGAALVLSLGPYLKLGRISLGIPLPVLFLRDLLPGLDSVRSWGRFSVFVMLGMSVLASSALLLSLRKRSWRDQRLGIALILIAALSTSWIGPASLVRVEGRAVDSWLAEQPGEFAIMQYPLDVAMSGPSMLYTRYHTKRTVFAYGTYLPLIFRSRHPELTEFPMNSALDQLAAWEVRYILINVPALDRMPDDESFTLADVHAQSRLRYITMLGDEAVYKLIN